MPYVVPTDEYIKFLNTKVKDPFPTCFNAGNSAIPERNTKVWAEYYNKIRTFLGYVEPLCTTNTAENEGGIESIYYWTLNPAPSLSDIIYGAAKEAYSLGKSPPTCVFPFEIVISKSSDNYSNWPKLHGTTPPMLYKASSSILQKTFYGDVCTSQPMVKCCILSSQSRTFSTRWTVNSYCMAGTDTLLIRGSIVDLNNTGVVTSQLPPLHYSFPNSDIQKLHVTLIGVRS